LVYADLGWHLLGGSWILSHGQVPETDPINTFGFLWIDYHWLSQILFYKIYTVAGFNGLRVLLGVVMGFLAVLLSIIIHRTIDSNKEIIPALLAFLLSITFIGELTSIRPQMFLLLFLALSYLILTSARFRKIELPILITLSIIGSNIHVYWIFIPILWFIFRIVPGFSKSNTYSSIYVWSGLLLLSLSALISPYGIFSSDTSHLSTLANYLVLFDYATMPQSLREYISELRGGLSGGGIVSYLLLVAAFLVARTQNRQAINGNFGNLISTVFSFALTIRALKFSPIFGLFGAQVLADSISKLFKGDLLALEKISTKLGPVILKLGIIYISIIAIRTSPWMFDSSQDLSVNQPVVACAKIKDLNLSQQPGRDHIRVLTHFDHGGWCRWAAYEKDPSFDMRVTTDGRTQLVPVEHYKESFDLYRLRGQWANTLASWAPDVVLVNKSQPLAQILVRAPSEWKLVHEDSVFALFIPIK